MPRKYFILHKSLIVSFATNVALNPSIESSAKYCILYTHLQPIGVTPGGRCSEFLTRFFASLKEEFDYF